MKKIVFLFLFSYSTPILAQEFASLNIEKFTSSEFHFEDLKNTTDLFSFRFWNIGQVIEFRMLSDSTKVGTIINFAIECPFTNFMDSKPCDENDNLNVFVQKTNLSSEQIKKALETMQRNTIYEFPLESSIKGWVPILDKENFSIEQKVNGIYNKKEYNSPRLQKNNLEAKQFIKFFTELNYAVKANESAQTFWKALKPGCYKRRGNSEIICKDQ